ncbi:MAG: putative sulfate exporter family transporter [Hyphomicrobiales bacterium]|nr:putative sulfate exporter family transporter [Hyphomicrobiales bacterium]
MLKNIPGILLALAIAYIGAEASKYIGVNILGFAKSPISSIMLAIIFGIVLANSINLPKQCDIGFKFCIKYILKFGIILLGIRLGLLDILKIGIIGLPVIIVCISAALLIANYLSKSLNVSTKMGALIAVGTGICGATAIVATAPAIDAKKEEVTYAIGVITVFGIIAMFLYPYLAHYIFKGDELFIGLFLGTSIHETAQVAGSGLIYSTQFDSPKTLDIATVTKLVRNTCMVIIIPAVSYFYYLNQRDSSDIKKSSIVSIFPFFIFGFIGMGIIRTIGDYGIENSDAAFIYLDPSMWDSVIHIIKTSAEYLLAIAMAAVGLSTNVSSLRSLGVKPLYVGLITALSVGLFSILTIYLIKILGIAI